MEASQGGASCESYPRPVGPLGSVYPSRCGGGGRAHIRAMRTDRGLGIEGRGGALSGGVHTPCLAAKSRNDETREWRLVPELAGTREPVKFLLYARVVPTSPAGTSAPPA